MTSGAREQLGEHFARKQKTRVGAASPGGLELFRSQLERTAANGIADIEHGGPQLPERLNFACQTPHVVLRADIARERSSLAAGGGDFVSDRANTLGIPTG